MFGARESSIQPEPVLRRTLPAQTARARSQARTLQKLNPGATCGHHGKRARSDSVTSRSQVELKPCRDRSPSEADRPRRPVTNVHPTPQCTLRRPVSSLESSAARAGGFGREIDRAVASHRKACSATNGTPLSHRALAAIQWTCGVGDLQSRSTANGVAAGPLVKSAHTVGTSAEVRERIHSFRRRQKRLTPSERAASVKKKPPALQAGGSGARYRDRRQICRPIKLNPSSTAVVPPSGIWCRGV